MNPNKALWEKGDFTEIADYTELEIRNGDLGTSGDRILIVVTAKFRVSSSPFRV